jgi:DNA-binding NarL/FixJ family response regulator
VRGVTHVILDLMLPDGTGLKVLEELHRSGSPARVAVVTGEKGPIIQEAAQFRPDLILHKPINVNQLLSWLSQP